MAAKIKEVIDIKSGYTSYVDLTNEYYDALKNRERMERYMPIKAHRLVFEKVASALNPKDRRFYFLSGSYGTGKSHLCLMLANYFARQTDLPEMESFFHNYQEAQNDAQKVLKEGEIFREKPASTLKAARKEGRLLVAVCRYGLNLEFEGTVLRAIEEALKKDELDIPMETHYKEALRRIKNWEKRKAEKRFYQDMLDEIENSFTEWTIKDIIKGLQNSDESALQVFKKIYKTVTDTDFTFSMDNLQDILKDMLTNTTFKSVYKGIFIIYDEFGYALDDGLVNLSKLHEFAQFCANSGMEHLPMIFLGTGHKSFKNHGLASDAVHFTTLEARVNEIPLQTEGLEDIIAAIVHQKKDSSEWTKNVAPHTGIFTNFAKECKRLNLFNWLPAPKLKANIIENIYPMHPLATYALLQLAGEAGSDNRSVFKFFSPEFETGETGWINVQEFSYPWFAERNIIEAHEKLNLYTEDLLYDYFRDSLKTDNRDLRDRVRKTIADYEETLKEMLAYLKKDSLKKLFDEEDELMHKILKAMLINEIISTESTPVHNTLENIKFALNAVSAQDAKALEERLKRLCQANILYNSKGIYEFKRSDVIDIERRIQEFKINPDNRPGNVLHTFLEHLPLTGEEEYLEAKSYNITYNEDKRLKFKFVLPSEIEQDYTIDGQAVTFFEMLENKRCQIKDPRMSHEGTAVYVFCETDKDIDLAKRHIIKNSQDRIVISVPQKALPVLEDVLTLDAIKSIQQSDEAKNFGPHENTVLRKRKEEAMGALKKIKEKYFSPEAMDWFTVKGDSLFVSNKYDPANKLMEQLFSAKRNIFSHTNFNKCHLKLNTNDERMFKEACEHLLDLSSPVEIDLGWPDNTGGIRYLKRCFVDNQVLKFLDEKGEKRKYEVEREANKFGNVFPSYLALLQDIEAASNPVSCNSFLEKYFEEYGQGRIAVTLMFLLARRYYRDSLRVKREEGALTDIKFADFESVYSLVCGEKKTAVLFFEPMSEEEKQFYNLVCTIFSPEDKVAGKNYSIHEAFQSLISWWDNLDPIARSLDFYVKENERLFIQTMLQAKTKDPFGFMKNDLLAVFFMEPEEKISPKKLKEITDFLKAIKENVENTVGNKQREIVKQVSNIFYIKGELDLDLQDGIREWYNSLDSYQKDPYSSFHNNDSKPLLKIKELTNIQDFLFAILPDAYGLQPLASWTADKTEDYMNKVKRGKKHIEENESPVHEPIVEFKRHSNVEGDTVYHKGKLEICIRPAEKGEEIWLTDDGSDPTDLSAERKIIKTGYTIEVTGKKMIKLVACDGKGKYSRVKTVNVIDETEKNIIKRQQLGITDEKIMFVFPKTKEEMRATFSSLLKEIIEANFVTIEELQKEIKDILRKLEEKAKK